MAVDPCLETKKMGIKTGKTRERKTHDTTITGTCPNGCKRKKYNVKTYTIQDEIEKASFFCTKLKHSSAVRHKWKKRPGSTFIWRNSNKKRYVTKWSCGHK
jgi:hypothetical protein